MCADIVVKHVLVLNVIARKIKHFGTQDLGKIKVEKREKN